MITAQLVFGFIAGFAADALRSVILPATTDRIARLIPSERRKRDLQDNALLVDLMSKLDLMGLDPSLAARAKDPAEEFSKIIQSHRQAFIEASAEVIESEQEAVTQLEMNMEAGHRAEIAEMQLGRLLLKLEGSSWFEGEMRDAFREAQDAWETYARRQADFVALQYAGGSMRPMVYAGEIEAATIARTAELRRMLDDMRDRMGE